MVSQLCRKCWSATPPIPQSSLMPSGSLFSTAGLGQGSSLLDFVSTSGAAAQVIENWAEVGHHLLQRLAGESRAAGGLHAFENNCQPCQ